MTASRRVVVSGRVQGVFFRAACQQEAERRGVVGWVRNRGDGSVEAHFEGDPGDVDAMVGWARRGPRHARVDSVEVHDAAPQGARRFEVR